jgi:hypothetical protein
MALDGRWRQIGGGRMAVGGARPDRWAGAWPSTPGPASLSAQSVRVAAEPVTAGAALPRLRRLSESASTRARIQGCPSGGRHQRARPVRAADGGSMACQRSVRPGGGLSSSGVEQLMSCARGRSPPRSWLPTSAPILSPDTPPIRRARSTGPVATAFFRPLRPSAPIDAAHTARTGVRR